MSEVKRYGSAVFDSGLIEMSCGDYVTYSDYQKLVAENAELKALQGEIYDYTQQFTNSDDREMWNAMHDIYKLSSPLETPATDAAIAEIKAQGVELLRDSIPDIETGIEDTRDLNHYCTDFSANLRAGRKG